MFVKLLFNCIHIYLLKSNNFLNKSIRSFRTEYFSSKNNKKIECFVADMDNKLEITKLGYPRKAKKTRAISI